HFLSSLIIVCSSLRSLLCLFERNIALQPKIQGNLGDLYAQNYVSVSKLQICFKGCISRIPSVFRYRGHFLPAYPSLGTDVVVKQSEWICHLSCLNYLHDLMLYVCVCVCVCFPPLSGVNPVRPLAGCCSHTEVSLMVARLTLAHCLSLSPLSVSLSLSLSLS